MNARSEESTMFRNPWIDPRVVQVRSVAAQTYLDRHGWKRLTPEQPNLVPYERPADGDSNQVVVPLLEQGRDYPQRVIELITDLAISEGRYAVDVLSDILQQPAAEASAVNGINTPAQAEPAAR